MGSILCSHLGAGSEGVAANALVLSDSINSDCIRIVENRLRCARREPKPLGCPTFSAGGIEIQCLPLLCSRGDSGLGYERQVFKVGAISHHDDAGPRLRQQLSLAIAEHPTRRRLTKKFPNGQVPSPASAPTSARNPARSIAMALLWCEKRPCGRVERFCPGIESTCVSPSRPNPCATAQRNTSSCANPVAGDQP